jgi:hypothetical protein
MGETCIPIEIHCQLIKEYVDAIMRVEQVKNLCKKLKNCGKDICSDDNARWPSVSWNGCECSTIVGTNFGK